MRFLRCLVLVWLIPATSVLADEFRPALLEITESEGGRYAVTWKTPLRNGSVLPLQPRLPNGLEQQGPVSARTLGSSRIEQSRWQGEPGALVGATIEIEGLRALQIDVIVQIDLLDGSEHSGILRAASPEWTVPERATAWTVAFSYWEIGTIHILEGFDHLLFVLALILIVPGR